MTTPTIKCYIKSSVLFGVIHLKIDRLIGILSILLQTDKVTAPYLAEKFEVSRRTINRDIDVLCLAGIPIVTTQGKNGGISIMSGYKIDHALLTSSDMQAILTGLRSLDSVSGTNRYRQLMDKLSVDKSSVFSSDNHIIINLASWDKSKITPKIELIQSAIEMCKKIHFRYYAPNKESQRTIEPYFLIFEWSSWYVWGYCDQRRDYRMFKLNRLTDLYCTEEKFDKRNISPPNFSDWKDIGESVIVKAKIAPSEKWRLIEEFGVEFFEEQPDGSLIFKFEFWNESSAIQYILSFGGAAEILEPKELRGKISDVIAEINKKYS